MYIYVKPQKHDGPMYSGQTIFPRPTPWRVAWEASFLRLLGKHTYKMVFIDRKYAEKLHTYDIVQQDNHIVLYDGKDEIVTFGVYDITWAMAIEYNVQSFLYGFMFRFWEWRWSENGKLTNGELRQKLARMEGELDASVIHRHSQRIQQRYDNQE